MGKSWITAAALTIVVALSASAIAISQRAPITGKTTLRFNLQGVAGENLDLGQPGESLGDQFVSSSLLLQHGTKVGRLDSVCSITNLDPTTVLCHAGLKVNGSGEIELIGRASGDGLSGQADIKVAVAGGTGAYRHSHGYVVVDTANSIMTLVVTP
jgi:hypothetical protein